MYPVRESRDVSTLSTVGKAQSEISLVTEPIYSDHRDYLAYSCKHVHFLRFIFVTGRDSDEPIDPLIWCTTRIRIYAYAFILVFTSKVPSIEKPKGYGLCHFKFCAVLVLYKQCRY